MPRVLTRRAQPRLALDPLGYSGAEVQVGLAILDREYGRVDRLDPGVLIARLVHQPVSARVLERSFQWSATATITAGNWIVVFEDPIGCFVAAGCPNPELVHCFRDGDEILLRHAELYEMLHRRRLVDTLSLALDVPEALEFLPPDTIGDCYRAVMVATSAATGAERKKFPTRTVYPAVLINSPLCQDSCRVI